MSTISTVVGTVFRLDHLDQLSKSWSSGTLMNSRLGSIVQKGKFALCAFALDRQRMVDLPLGIHDATFEAMIGGGLQR